MKGERQQSERREWQEVSERMVESGSAGTRAISFFIGKAPSSVWPLCLLPNTIHMVLRLDSEVDNAR